MPLRGNEGSQEDGEKDVWESMFAFGTTLLSHPKQQRESRRCPPLFLKACFALLLLLHHITMSERHQGVQDLLRLPWQYVASWKICGNMGGRIEGNLILLRESWGWIYNNFVNCDGYVHLGYVVWRSNEILRADMCKPFPQTLTLTHLYTLHTYV